MVSNLFCFHYSTRVTVISSVSFFHLSGPQMVCPFADHYSCQKWLFGWRFGTFIIFPYVGNNDPNWLFFQRGWNHQPVVVPFMGSQWRSCHQMTLKPDSISCSAAVSACEQQGRRPPQGLPAKLCILQKNAENLILFWFPRPIERNFETWTLEL